jgi:surface antigen
LAVLLVAAQPLPAMARALQCVPYAREVSGIEIQGNARTWWGQAEGRYDRGSEPKVGAVLAFRPTNAMPQGHVAVVGEIVDDRHILLDHANWSGPGKIEHHALAEDVSEAGDWSEVKVWYAPIGKLGTRENPTFGFIYSDAPAAAPVTDIDSITFAAAFADLVPASETTVVVPTLALASAR